MNCRRDLTSCLRRKDSNFSTGNSRNSIRHRPGNFRVNRAAFRGRISFEAARHPTAFRDNRRRISRGALVNFRGRHPEDFPAVLQAANFPAIRMHPGIRFRADRDSLRRQQDFHQREIIAFRPPAVHSISRRKEGYLLRSRAAYFPPLAAGNFILQQKEHLSLRLRVHSPSHQPDRFLRRPPAPLHHLHPIRSARRLLPGHSNPSLLRPRHQASHRSSSSSERS